jgi:hypothetical protein
MRGNLVPLVAAVLLVAAIALSYLTDDIVPVFIASVIGLPVAAYVLNRTSPPEDR